MQNYRYPISVAPVLAARTTDAALGAAQRKKTEAEKFAERLARLVQRRTGGMIHQLRVEIKPEGIYLDGQCAAYYLKQLAQEAVLAITEDQKLINQIEVG
jgi:hypothetical protein